MILEFFTHIDQNLILIIQTYGFWIYPLIFLVIFIETGIVIFPFLPGDSLLFVSGALASKGLISVLLVFLIAVLAAIIGDTVNYWIGHFIGEKVSQSRFVKKEYLERTHNFYSKHGGKTIIIARFIPIIRTFAPFVAGIGNMKYGKFLSFNVIGGILWTSLFISAGYFFGNIPLIQNNLSFVILAIIVISFIPVLFEFFRGRMKRQNYHNRI